MDRAAADVNRDALGRGDYHGRRRVRGSPSITVPHGGIEIRRVSRIQAVHFGTNRQLWLAPEDVKKFDAGVLVQLDFIGCSRFESGEKRIEFSLVGGKMKALASASYNIAVTAASSTGGVQAQSVVVLNLQ